MARCDFCPSGAKMHCRICDIKLCAECNVIHSTATAKTSQRHVTLPYSEVSSDKGKSVHVVYCRECKSATIGKCSCQSKRDQAADLDFTRQKLQRDTEDLEETILKNLEKVFSNLLQKKLQIPVFYQQLLTTIQEQGRKWQKMVEQVVQKKVIEVNEILHNHVGKLDQNLKEIDQVMKDYTEETQKGRQLLLSGSTDAVKSYRPSLNKTIEIKLTDIAAPAFYSVSPDCKVLEKEFGEISLGAVTERNISLGNRQLNSFMRKPKVTGHLSSGLRKSELVTCDENDAIWVACRRSLRRISRQNVVLEKIELYSGYIYGICVANEDTLVYSNKAIKEINFVKQKKQIGSLSLHGWRPCGMCTSASGDLLVCMRNETEDAGKVVRFSGSKVTQEIQTDSEKKPLFSPTSKMMYIAENRNSDVCVSDYGGMAVVVVDSEGTFRFRYTGLLGNTALESFSPFGIATDIQSRILVADRDNDRIHVTDGDGHFLLYVTVGLSQPYSVCVSRDNLLFVGSESDDKVTIIEYSH